MILISSLVAFMVFDLKGQVSALDNGLALTPPMGWMSWERFRCNTDCENDPLNCISENLFKTMADEMVLKGFKDVGYEYVIIDDCWLDHERDENGRLKPDPKRFPSGIKALADYVMKRVHSLGLKFGIYEDYGNLTCGGYPGILGHLATDAQTFAEWEVDYVKLDGCYVDIHMMDQGYPEFGNEMNKTGRPIVYSCSWPAYWDEAAGLPDYPSIQKHCNLWRNYGDIQDNWDDVVDIIDHYGDKQGDFAQYAGPGNWNDPDMLIIGNFALSIEQSKTQMAMWAVLAAPLIMSNDLRKIRPEFVEILQNRNVIQIDQDPLGHQGRRVYHNKQTKVDVYVKQIMPIVAGNTSAAVAILFKGDDGTPAKVSLNAHMLGLEHSAGYAVQEVFLSKPIGTFGVKDTITVEVNPNGVQLLKFEVINKYEMNDLSPFKWHQNSIEAADFLTELKVESKGRHGLKKKKNEL